MRPSPLQKLILLLAVLSLLSACTAPAVIPTATPLPSATLPNTIVPTATATETATGIPTHPSTLSPTLPPPTVTHTPQPTLSPDEAQQVILDLLAGNGGCQLPCLWGFTPGQTDLETARTFVSRFGIGDIEVGDIQISANDYGDVGGVGISYPKNNVSIIVDFSYYKSRESSHLGLLSLYSYPMENLGTDPNTHVPLMSPVWGNATFNRELQNYLLSSILTTYGQPSQVLLTVMPDPPDRPDLQYHPFSLALVYPDKGIYVEYVSLRETRGKNFVGCPDKSHIFLGVWDPHDALPLEYVLEKAGGELILSYLKPLEEATSLTLETFYQTFKNPENTPCLETPSESWPVP